jgi:formylglycine-generating enzyme required for sulfatase activity
VTALLAFATAILLGIWTQFDGAEAGDADLGAVPNRKPEPDNTATDAHDSGQPQKVITNSIGMKLTLIPAGEFLMGSSESPEELRKAFRDYVDPFPWVDHFADEYPRHRVRITKPFYLGTCHVTVGQFRKFVEDTAYKTDAEKNGKGGVGIAIGPDGEEVTGGREFNWRNTGFAQTDEHPVVNVSWNDATAFCRWLSHKDGKTYLLPTEAQWEYACRAGTTTRFWNGDDPEKLAQVGNVLDATCKAKFPGTEDWAIHAADGYVFTSPVGRFRRNAFGLYDMHGNAAQWCSDWYGAKYYEASPADDPSGPNSGKTRVQRGSAWGTVGPSYSMSAYRVGAPPGDSGFGTGFRVVSVLCSARTPVEGISHPKDGGHANHPDERKQDREPH